MTEVLHIPVSNVPKLRCFDENTELIMADDSSKKIKDICPGDQLKYNGLVTATIQVSSQGLHMYRLGDIIVSSNHKIRYLDHFIPVSRHPDANIIDVEYSSPHVYCLNTESKLITISGYQFLDWDEVVDDTMEISAKIKRHLEENDFTTNEGPTTPTRASDIHKFLDGGFVPSFKIQTRQGLEPINKIRIGDALSNRCHVYGTVRITMNGLTNCKHVENKSGTTGALYHLLTTNGQISTEQGSIYDYNYYVDSILTNDDNS